MKIISLHGKYSGYAKISGKEIQTRGVPNDCELLALCDRVVPISEADENTVKSVYAVQDKKIVMEGCVRGGVIRRDKVRQYIQGRSLPVKSHVLSEILERADEVFRQNTVPPVPKTDEHNIFGDTYPGSKWKKIMHRNGSYHYEGIIDIEGVTLHAVALPCDFYTESYFMKNGFNRNIKDIHGRLYRIKTRRI